MHLHAHLRFGGARHFFSWLPSLPDPPIPVTMRSGLTVLARRADSIVFYEQFGLDVYGVELPLRSVETILDLGANIGFSTLALAARYPQAKFICVEPFQESRALLRRNLSRNGVDATVLGVAVVGESGRFDIAGQQHPGANAITRSPDGPIVGVTLDRVIDQAGIDSVDLMKIDVEGAELGIFQHAASWADRVGAVIGELHNGLTPDQAADLLRPHGFVPWPLPDTERFRGLACFVKSSAADGRALPSAQSFGATGVRGSLGYESYP